MNCPRCGVNIDKKKWGDTGLTPNIHILVKSCDCSPDLITEREIVDSVIEKNRERLEFLLKVHHIWPDGVDLVWIKSGCSKYMVRSRLVSKGLW